MGKITQKDISNKIRALFEPETESGILPLLRILASKSAMPPPQQLTIPQESTTPVSPTMPNLAGKQQLMDINTIAQKYPYLGAR